MSLSSFYGSSRPRVDEADFARWKELAKSLKEHSWPLCPCVCDDDDGWTYSLILKAFDVPASQVVRARRGWLVFSTRTMLINFVRNSQLLLF